MFPHIDILMLLLVIFLTSPNFFCVHRIDIFILFLYLSFDILMLYCLFFVCFTLTFSQFFFWSFCWYQNPCFWISLWHSHTVLVFLLTSSNFFLSSCCSQIDILILFNVLHWYSHTFIFFVRSWHSLKLFCLFLIFRVYVSHWHSQVSVIKLGLWGLMLRQWLFVFVCVPH